MPAHLIQKNDGETSAYPLDKPIVVIGRADDCDIVIRKTMKLSRRHCCIAQVNGKLVIRDLGSMNGLKINGVRTIENELFEGDEIQLGDLKFQLSLSSKPNAVIKKTGRNPIPEKRNSEKKSSAPRPLDLSLDFPQIVNEEPPLLPNRSGAVKSAKVKAHKDGSGKKSAPKQAGLLDSGDLDVRGLNTN